MQPRRISFEAAHVSLAQPMGEREVAGQRLRALASKTVSKGKGAGAWLRQLRRELRELEQAMGELAETTRRSQYQPAVLVLAKREGAAMYLRWRAPSGFLNGATLAQQLCAEPQSVRRWYAKADTQAALLNAQASAARYALRLAQHIQQAEPV